MTGSIIEEIYIYNPSKRATKANCILREQETWTFQDEGPKIYTLWYKTVILKSIT